MIGEERASVAISGRSSHKMTGLHADVFKSPVKYAGNGFAHVAHLNAVSMETAYLSRWFYSEKCFPR